MVASPLRYRIFPKHPAAHLFEVSVVVGEPNPSGQCFMLPVWIPGSYMIREFARNIITLRAEAGGLDLNVEKIDKATWRCAPTKQAITLTYDVYAWDLSVRAAHLDETHGFFNGTSVFLLPLGKEEHRCEVEICPPAGEAFLQWQVATALARMPANGKASNTSPALEFGNFYAANYDELIDHPVEMGSFTHATFEACGVTHHIAITGKHRADMARLCADMKKICEAQIALFEPETKQAPMKQYWFLIMAIGDGYGGLEHRASTALLCKRDDLPLLHEAHETKISEGYRRFLGLVSHEYFHTWNVKRIKPTAFMPYDLSRENYTRQLWAFEGITSYYDDLILVRCGLIDELSYLELLAETIGKVMSQNGRHKQSVAESSFDAWTKYYRPDENAPNAIVSYYQKGAMVALALDLTIRAQTQNTKSLDDVMRTLWNAHGKTGIGVPEGVVEKMAAQISGINLDAFFADYVYGTNDLPLAELFKQVAINITFRAPKNNPPWLGAKISSDHNGDAKCAQVFDDGPAQAAGLSAGDTIVALEGLRVTAANIERSLRRHTAGSKVTMLGCRRDEMMTFDVVLAAPAPHICVLTTLTESAKALNWRGSWLNTPLDSN